MFYFRQQSEEPLTVEKKPIIFPDLAAWASKREKRLVVGRGEKFSTAREHILEVM